LRDLDGKEVISLRKAPIRRPMLVGLLALGVTGAAMAQRDYGRTAAYETLPAGTVLKVRLEDRLNSSQAQPGQRFTATVKSDEDRSGLPTGTRVEGVVREARAASKSQPGVLDVDFTALQLPDGRDYPIRGSLTSLDSSNVTRAADGRLVSRQNSKSDRVKFIGYGAGAGALFSLLTKGGLLKGALIGAAGGYLYDQLTKNKGKGGYSNVDLREGSEFGVRLDQQFALLPVSNGSSPLTRSDRYDPGLHGRPRSDSSVSARRDRFDSSIRDSGSVSVLVDGRAVSFGSARPMRIGDTMMYPLAPVLEAAGQRQFYNPLTRTITINRGQESMTATAGSDVVTVNGERERLAEPIRTINGSLYVPERFLELATGMNATWDQARQTLRLGGGVLEQAPDRLRNDRHTPG
jgi:hypothetical protein